MNTTRTSPETSSLRVLGLTLHYEIRGFRPSSRLHSGGPTDAGMFADLAGHLADRYTVVTDDPRGPLAQPA
jgi:hypothetical protein